MFGIFQVSLFLMGENKFGFIIAVAVGVIAVIGLAYYFLSGKKTLTEKSASTYMMNGSDTTNTTNGNGANTNSISSSSSAIYGAGSNTLDTKNGSRGYYMGQAYSVNIEADIYNNTKRKQSIILAFSNTKKDNIFPASGMAGFSAGFGGGSGYVPQSKMASKPALANQLMKNACEDLIGSLNVGKKAILEQSGDWQTYFVLNKLQMIVGFGNVPIVIQEQMIKDILHDLSANESGVNPKTYCSQIANYANKDYLQNLAYKACLGIVDSIIVSGTKDSGVIRTKLEQIPGFVLIPQVKRDQLIAEMISDLSKGTFSKEAFCYNIANLIAGIIQGTELYKQCLKIMDKILASSDHSRATIDRMLSDLAGYSLVAQDLKDKIIGNIVADLNDGGQFYADVHCMNLVTAILDAISGSEVYKACIKVMDKILASGQRDAPYVSEQLKTIPGYLLLSPALQKHYVDDVVADLSDSDPIFYKEQHCADISAAIISAIQSSALYKLCVGIIDGIITAKKTHSTAFVTSELNKIPGFSILSDAKQREYVEKIDNINLSVDTKSQVAMICLDLVTDLIAAGLDLNDPFTMCVMVVSNLLFTNSASFARLSDADLHDTTRTLLIANLPDFVKILPYDQTRIIDEFIKAYKKTSTVENVCKLYVQGLENLAAQDALAKCIAALNGLVGLDSFKSSSDKAGYAIAFLQNNLAGFATAPAALRDQVVSGVMLLSDSKTTADAICKSFLDSMGITTGGSASNGSSNSGNPNSPCLSNPASLECKSFCLLNPSDASCVKTSGSTSSSFCLSHPSDPSCLQNGGSNGSPNGSSNSGNPNSPCLSNPASLECKSFCLLKPSDASCVKITGPSDSCLLNPSKPSCVNTPPINPCLLAPKSFACVVNCEQNPTDPTCKKIAANPAGINNTVSNIGISDYCKANPADTSCQTSIPSQASDSDCAYLVAVVAPQYQKWKEGIGTASDAVKAESKANAISVVNGNIMAGNYFIPQSKVDTVKQYIQSDAENTCITTDIKYENGKLTDNNAVNSCFGAPLESFWVRNSKKETVTPMINESARRAIIGRAFDMNPFLSQHDGSMYTKDIYTELVRCSHAGITDDAWNSKSTLIQNFVTGKKSANSSGYDLLFAPITTPGSKSPSTPKSISDAATELSDYASCVAYVSNMGDSPQFTANATNVANVFEIRNGSDVIARKDLSRGTEIIDIAGNIIANDLLNEQFTYELADIRFQLSKTMTQVRTRKAANSSGGSSSSAATSGPANTYFYIMPFQMQTLYAQKLKCYRDRCFAGKAVSELTSYCRGDSRSLQIPCGASLANKYCNEIGQALMLNTDINDTDANRTIADVANCAENLPATAASNLQKTQGENLEVMQLSTTNNNNIQSVIATDVMALFGSFKVYAIAKRESIIRLIWEKMESKDARGLPTTVTTEECQDIQNSVWSNRLTGGGRGLYDGIAKLNNTFSAFKTKLERQKDYLDDIHHPPTNRCKCYMDKIYYKIDDQKVSSFDLCGGKNTNSYADFIFGIMSAYTGYKSDNANTAVSEKSVCDTTIKQIKTIIQDEDEINKFSTGAMYDALKRQVCVQKLRDIYRIIDQMRSDYWKPDEVNGKYRGADCANLSNNFDSVIGT